MTAELDLEFKQYYVEELYMIEDVETGVLYNRSGRRMLALTDDFLIGLHRALEKQCGDRASDVIHKCGRRWGRDFGEGVAAEWSDFYGQPYREFPMALLQSLLVQEFAHNGWGQLVISYRQFDRGVICLELKGAIMAAIRPDEADAAEPDVLTAGILGGMFSYFLDREVDCIQSQSESHGHESSMFIISSQSRIDQIRQNASAQTTHEELLLKLLETT